MSPKMTAPTLSPTPKVVSDHCGILGFYLKILFGSELFYF